MSFSLGDGVYFRHCPKTGGTWVRRACRAAGLPFERVISQHDERVGRDARFVFTFARDPADWLRSFWRHNAHRGWASFPRHWSNVTQAPTWRLFHLGQGLIGEPFDVFVEHYLAELPGAISHEFQRYAAGADFIGRTERLRLDTVEALTLSSLEFDEAALLAHPPANVARHAWVDYAPGQVERLREVEA